MSKNAGTFRFGVEFQAANTSGLNSIKKQLQEIQNMEIKDLVKIENIDNANAKLNEIKQTAQKVSAALEESYNVKLDTININKFNQLLSQSGLSMTKISQEFGELSKLGPDAFAAINSELLTTNQYVAKTSKLLDKMADTMANTVRWTIASSAMNAFTGSIQKAYGFTQSLDRSLNDIVIVTGKSSDEMARFSREANAAAKRLGAVTTDYTDAALIYYQQGLSDPEVKARTETTTKVSNITKASADQASELLTAIWNGYKVNADEAEEYIDKVSAVAADTAADLEELSTGMSRVASAANIMGVDIDQLNAQLATIVSITREAPESIGTALKTVYARMSDIQAGIDNETTLDEYTAQLEAMGYKVLDNNGKLRDMGDVVEEIGESWNTLSRNQQVSVAQTIAGTRQYSRMMALFDNWNMYENAKATSMNSAGALDRQNARYMESMEAHLNQSAAALEGLYDSLLDPKGLNKIIDVFTKLVEMVDGFVESLGGGGSVLLNLGALAMNLFDNQITRGITRTVTNIEGLKSNLQQSAAQAEVLKQTLADSSIANDEAYSAYFKQIEEAFKYRELMTEEEQKALDLLHKQTFELIQQKKQKEEVIKANQKTKDVLDIKSEDDFGKVVKSQIDTLEGINTSKDIDAFIKNLNTASEEVARVQKRVSTYKGQANSAQKRTAIDQMIEDLKRDIQNAQANPGERNVDILADQREIAALELMRPTSNYNLDKANKSLENALEELKTKKTELENIQAKALGEEGILNSSNRDAGLQGMISAIETIKQLDLISTEELEELKIAEGLLANIQNKTSKNKTLNSEDYANAAKALESYKTARDKTVKALNEQIEAEKTLGAQMSKIDDLLNKSKADVKKFVASFDVASVTKGFVAIGTSIASANAGISTLANLTEIWNDNMISGGEKLTRTFSNLAVSVPALVNSVTNLKQGLKAVAEPVKGMWNSVQNWKENQKSLQLVANQIKDMNIFDEFSDKSENGKEQNLYNAIISTGNKELQERYEALRVVKGELNENQKAELEKIKTDFLATAQSKTLTVALKEQAAAWLAANWYLLVIVAAIALVVASMKIYESQIKKNQKAAEEANKAAEEQASAYENVKNAYESLKESIEDYKDSQKAIDELTAGTEEWRDAIEDANKQVLSLIESYPELAAQIENVNGRLTFKDGALEALEERQKEAVDYAYVSKLNATAAANTANDLATAEIIANNSSYVSAGSIGKGWLKSISAGGLLNLGEDIARQEFASAYKDYASVDQVNALARYSQTDEGIALQTAKTFEEFKKALEDSTEETIKDIASNNALVKELYKQQGAIVSLGESIDKNTEINKALYQQMAATAINDSIVYQNSEYKEQLSAIYGVSLERRANIIAEGRTDKNTSEAQQVEDTREYLKRLKESGQIRDFEENINAVLGSDDVKYTITNLDGSQENKTKSFNEISRELAGLEAMDEITDADLTKTQQALEELAKENIAYLTFAGGKGGNFGEMTEAEFKAAEEAGFAALMDNFKELGYTSDELTDKIEEAKKAFEEDLTEISNILGKDATIFANLLGDNWQYVNTNIRKDAASAYANAYTKEDQNIIGQVIQDLEAKGMNETWNELIMGMDDWSDYSDISNLRTGLAEVLDNDSIIPQFIAAMQKINNVGYAFNEKSAQENWSKVQAVLSTVANIGDTIDKEAYDNLSADAKKYFTEMGNGMYALNDEAIKLAKTIDSMREDQKGTYTRAKEAKDQADWILDSVLNDKGRITNWYSSEDLGLQAMLSSGQLDEGDEKFVKEIKELLDSGYKPTNDQATKFAGILKSFYERQQTSATASFESVGQFLASTATSMEELRSYYDQGSISYDQLTNYKKLLFGQRDELDDNYLMDENAEIDRLSNSLQQLQEKSELLFGDALTNNLEKQLEIIRDQKDVYENILQATKERIIAEQVAASSDFSELIGKDALKYDSQTGAILNLEEVLAIAKERINNASGSEKTVLEAQYEELQEWADKYNSHVSTLLQTISNLTKAEIEENQKVIDTANESLKQVEKEADRIKEINDLTRTLAGDDDFSAIEASYLSDIAWQEERIRETQEAMAVIRAEGLDNEINIAAYRELESKLMSEQAELQTLLNSLTDNHLNAIAKINDNYEEAVGYLEVMNSLTEHNLELYQLLNGETNYEGMKQYYADIIAQNKQIETFRYEEMARWQSEYQAAIDEGMDQTSEEFKALKDQYLDSVQSWQEATIASIQAINDEYMNNIDAWAKKLENTITNQLGFDAISAHWDWIKAEDDRFLDSVNRAFGIREVESAFDEALNTNKSLRAQQLLNEAKAKELKILNDMDKLSQYDLDRAKAQLEVTQARIALEEAQANKTQAQLVRDADGRYSYEYVADQEKINEAQQNFDEALNSVYNLDKEKFKSTLDDVYSMYQEFINSVSEAIKDGNLNQMELTNLENMYSSLQEISALVPNIENNLMTSVAEAMGKNFKAEELLTFMQSSLPEVAKNLSETSFESILGDLEGIVSEYANKLGEYKGKEVSNFTIKAAEAAQAGADAYGDAADKIKLMTERVDLMTTAWENNTKAILESIKAMALWKSLDKEGGDDGGTGENTIPGFSEKDEPLSFEEEWKQHYDKSSSSLDKNDLLSELAFLNDHLMAGTIDADKVEAVYDRMNLITERLNPQAKENESPIRTEIGNPNATKTELPNLAENPGEKLKEFFEKNKEYLLGKNLKMDYFHDYYYGEFFEYIDDNLDQKEGADFWNAIKKAVDEKAPFWQSLQKLMEEEEEKLEKQKQDALDALSADLRYGRSRYLNSSAATTVSMFDTGGYTGEWGPEGRLAMVHEKELILKPEDTENILSSVALLRRIHDQLDLSMADQLVSIADMFNKSISMESIKSGTIEQNVHIQAEFPNVTDKNEIEEAFEELVNLATQYVYTNNK